MKKIRLSGFYAIVLVVAALALGSTGSFAVDCPIKIGGIGPLSAPGAVMGGEAMRNAMTIAMDEVNAAGGLLGCSVEMVMGDTEGLPEKAIAVMERLIGQDKVVAVAGEYHSSSGLAAMEVAHRYGIPIVFAETWSDTITAKRYPEVFRLAPLSSEVANFQSKFVASIPNVQKVAIVVENTDFGRPNAEASVKVLEAMGIETTMFPVDIGMQDFSSIIQRMRATKPDAVLVIVTGEASYNFTQQAADAGMGPEDIPMVCDQTALESKAFWTNVPSGNYCFVMRIGIPRALMGEVAQSFEQVYASNTGKKAAESYAFAAYDAFKVIAEAIREAQSIDSQAIIKALENIKYKGALGTITFPYGMSNPPENSNMEDKWWHQFPDPAITMLQYHKKGQDSTDAVVVFPSQFQTGEPVFVKTR